MINELIIIKLIPLKGKEIFSKIKNNDPMINNVLTELKLYRDKFNLDFKYIIFKKVKFQMAANILFPYRIDNLNVKMNFDKIN